MTMTNENESPVPSFEDVLVAYKTLGSLLDNCFKGSTPPPSTMGAPAPAPQMPNKLGIIAAPPTKPMPIR